MHKKWKIIMILSFLVATNAFLFASVLPGGISDEESVMADFLPQNQAEENFTRPEGIPEASLDFINGEVTTSYTLDDILNMNETVPLISFNISETEKIWGFNPVQIMELLEWDADQIEIGAFDFNQTYDVQDLVLNDPDYYDDTAAEYPTVLAFAANVSGTLDWLNTSMPEDGHFRVYGFDLPGYMRISNVSYVKFKRAWQVDITVDGNSVGYIDSSNTTLGNYTTYDWGYFDNNTGSGWPGEEELEIAACSGWTIASIAEELLEDNQVYEINIMAADGWGWKWTFDRQEIVLGFEGTEINDPVEEMSNQGKQPMLMHQMDGQVLDYFDGPFRFMAPGLTKKYYIREVVEIRITVTGEWDLYNFPADPAPDFELTMTDLTGANSTYSVAKLGDMGSINYHSLPLVSKNISNNVSVIGFNPLRLMEVEGWGDAESIKIYASDGWNQPYSTEDLWFADKSYYDNSSTNATFIGFMANVSGSMKWLNDVEDSYYGNFSVFGDDLPGYLRIKNVTQLELDSLWTVNVSINGTTAFLFNSANASEVGEDLTYDWGYFDNETGFGWPDSDGGEAECTGYSIASIVDHALNDPDQNYTVTFIAIDGWGWKWAFTKDEIENGITGTMINDPETEMDNEGKIPMLMYEQDGEILGYHRGPYQTIMPGAEKSQYIGLIVEIQITAIPNTPTDTTTETTTTETTTTTATEEDRAIPGYTTMFLVTASLATIVVILHRKRL